MEEKENKCSVCGKEKKFAQAQTCSRECSNVIKRSKTYETRSCRACGAEFEERIKRERSFCTDACRVEWQSRPENVASRMQKTKEAVIEKYGVDSTFKVKEIQEKANDAIRKLYEEKGDELVAKVKATKLERYGDENYNNMDKNKITKSEIYGDENYNNREKAKETMLNLYGKEHAMQAKEIYERQQATMLKNYGVTSPLKNDDIKKKWMATNLEKYGYEFPGQSEDIKKKATETWRLRAKETKTYQTIITTLQETNIRLLNEFIGLTTPNYMGHKLILYDFECLKCNHLFSRIINVIKTPVCRKCNPLPLSPSTHTAIKQLLESNNITYIENDRKFLGNRMELDFIIPDRNVAIEMDGNYWHSEIPSGHDHTYHLGKTTLCHDKNMKLIHIFEDEVINNETKTLARLSQILGEPPQYNISSDFCEVKYVDAEAKALFLNENHLEGDHISSLNIGLFHDGLLVSMMTFYDLTADQFELSSFSSKIGYEVKDGFDKMLQFFIKETQPSSIAAFADIRWNGYDPRDTVYAKGGFAFQGYSSPNYWYFYRNDYFTRHPTFKFSKEIMLERTEIKELNEEEDLSSLTEWELAQLLGMDRIWDCGNMKFLSTRNISTTSNV